jgi:hypothetical protein
MAFSPCSTTNPQRKTMAFQLPTSNHWPNFILLLYYQHLTNAPLRELVLDLLEARFDTVTGALRERIQAITDETELKRLHRQAALAESLKTFQAKL